jgi:hypothetical protein
MQQMLAGRSRGDRAVSRATARAAYRSECLSRGPGEGAAAEQVDVEMVDGLAAVMAGVENDAVAAGEFLFAGNLGGGPEQVAEQRGMVRTGISEGCEMFARNDEHVDGRLRVDVGEGVTQRVLIDGRGRDASIDDFAE